MRMVTKLSGSQMAGNRLTSELDSGEGLRVDDAGDRPNLVHDHLPEDVEVLGLDLRDEVVLAEEGVELHDLFHLEQLVVDLVLLGRGGGGVGGAHCWGGA